MKTAALFALALLALSALPRPADACSPLPDAWQILTLEPAIDGQAVTPPEGPIVLVGEFSGTMTYARATEITRVVVRDGAEALAGRLAPLGSTGLVAWYPEAPLAADRVLSVGVEVAEEFADEIWNAPADLSVRVLDALPAAPTGVLALDPVELSHINVLGDCIEEGPCGSCGAFEELGERDIWQLKARVELDSDLYAGVQQVRTAAGADPAEALALLDRTPLQRRPIDLFWGSGVLDGWPSDEGCVAVEMRRPPWGVVVREVQCAPLPDHAEDIVAKRRRADAPALPAADRSAAACAVDPAAPATGVAGLLLLLALAARRRWPLLVALVAGVLGCDPVDDARPDAAAIDGSVDQPDAAPLDSRVDAADRGPDPDLGPDMLTIALDAGPDDDLGPPEGCFDLDCATDGRRVLPPLAHAPETPPITGGTLAVADSHDLAIAADPARDRVTLIHLPSATLRATLDAPGEPGRVAVDDTRGRAYVALRTGGAVLAIDLATHTTTRYPACAAPRGLAVDGDRLHVACASGALLTLDLDGQITRRVDVAPDLRDVVLAGGRLHLSRFTTAELITLDPDGAIIARRRPATSDVADDPGATMPNVAWRTLALDDDRVLMLHQRARLAIVQLDTEQGYGAGGTCGGPISTPALTVFDADPAVAPTELGRLGNATLAVDVAAIGDDLALAVPGNAVVRQRAMPAVQRVVGAFEHPRSCLFNRDGGGPAAGGEATAVAAWGDHLIALHREPAALYIGPDAIDLGGESVFDAGHDLFHKDTGSGIACATCHPEADTDGHTWAFERFGLRRTQVLRGGLAGTAPFHWTGDMRDLGHLLGEVMTRRMRGPHVPAAHADALLDWLDAQPAVRVDAFGPGDRIAGRDIFNDPVVGCAGCHTGPRLADGLRHDVGTGGRFETATLIGVGRLGTYLHDGCGATLEDRFDPECGGGEAHGRTAHLDDGQLADLIAYLRTL